MYKVNLYSLLHFLSHLYPFSLHSVFHTNLAPPPVSQGVNLLFLYHESLAFSFCMVNAADETMLMNINAVFTLLLNIHPLDFYNYA
jgi:hypothetical protein